MLPGWGEKFPVASSCNVKQGNNNSRQRKENLTPGSYNMLLIDSQRSLLLI